MRVTLIAAGALLTGCVDTIARFYSEVPQFQGQNIDAPVNLIGYPESQAFIAGRVVYTWTTARTMQMDLRPMHAPPVGALPSPIFASSSGPETMSVHFRCTLKVDTNETGTILHLSWEGRPSSCAP